MNLLVLLLAVLLLLVPSAWCWDYTISHWLVYFGKPDTFNFWWHGFAVSAIPGVGQLSFPVAGLTWLSTFFM